MDEQESQLDRIERKLDLLLDNMAPIWEKPRELYGHHFEWVKADKDDWDCTDPGCIARIWNGNMIIGTEYTPVPSGWIPGRLHYAREMFD